MLHATNRLRDRRAIAVVMRKGRPVGAGPLLIKLRSNQLSGSRAVVVVSKKVSKKATVRNRIRRRLAAIVADEWATVIPGYDIVITVRDDVADLPPAELTHGVLTALQRAGIRTAKP
jgi:ribonuclease P protein component